MKHGIKNLFILFFSFFVTVTFTEAQNTLEQKELHTPEEKQTLFKALDLIYTTELHLDETIDRRQPVSFYAEGVESQAYHEYLAQKTAQKYIAPLSIKFINEDIGYGIFAQKRFRKSSFIGEYTGAIEYNCSDPHATYTWSYPMTKVNEDKLFLLNARKFGNELRFVNHAGADSNCKALAIIGKDRKAHMLYVTTRAIKAGEQLTVDYGDTYWNYKLRRGNYKKL